MNLIELMPQIRERPEAFLQDDCVFQLRAFIRGFILAQNISSQDGNLVICEDHKLLDKFDTYTKNRYNVNPSDHVSVEEVLFDAEGKEAFFKYIELWFNYVQN
jgi:hypothetical protein